MVVGLLVGNGLATDATLMLKKGGYTLSVAGDGRVVRWTAPVFRLNGLRAGDRVVWARTRLHDGHAGQTRFFEPSLPDEPGAFALSVWEDPGQRMRVSALVFRAGTKVPRTSRFFEKCDVRLDLDVRVVDGQTATTRAKDVVVRLLKDDLRGCRHHVEVANAGKTAIECEVAIRPEDGRRGVRAKTAVAVPAGARKTVKLDGKLPHGALAHACRVAVRVRGRKELLVLVTRPWVAPSGVRGGDGDPPPPPDR